MSIERPFVDSPNLTILFRVVSPYEHDSDVMLIVPSVGKPDTLS